MNGLPSAQSLGKRKISILVHSCAVRGLLRDPQPPVEEQSKLHLLCCSLDEVSAPVLGGSHQLQTGALPVLASLLLRRTVFDDHRPHVSQRDELLVQRPHVDPARQQRAPPAALPFVRRCRAIAYAFDTAGRPSVDVMLSFKPTGRLSALSSLGARSI